MTRQRLLDGVRRYYEGTLRAYGATHRGVDWSTPESQELRFTQFLGLVADERSASVLDYGCGYGALAKFLRARAFVGPYCGFDLSDDMIAAAEAFTSSLTDCRFTSDPAALGRVDFVLASGIFNVRQEAQAEEWQTYIEDTIRAMAALARRGLAYNALTTYSDPERRRPGLHYLDPRAAFDFCKREISPRVSLVHDYTLYEFTMYVRL